MKMSKLTKQSHLITKTKEDIQKESIDRTTRIIKNKELQKERVRKRIEKIDEKHKKQEDKLEEKKLMARGESVLKQHQKAQAKKKTVQRMYSKRFFFFLTLKCQFSY